MRADSELPLEADDCTFSDQTIASDIPPVSGGGPASERGVRGACHRRRSVALMSSDMLRAALGIRCRRDQGVTGGEPGTPRRISTIALTNRRQL
jgi:hypothetical protein